MNYNRHRYINGDITDEHFGELVRIVQAESGALDVDGKCGPDTCAWLDGAIAGRAIIGKLNPPVFNVDEWGWLQCAGLGPLSHAPIHESWYYSQLITPDKRPGAIVAHYTATDHGTAHNMARHRFRKRRTGDRDASWHVSIEGDGGVVQMARFTAGCWHSRGDIEGLGKANRTSVGIELVGHGDYFPPKQVAAACGVWKAICGAYHITRAHAMVLHSELDPDRKVDPGPVWVSQHAPHVLDHAYGV